MPDQSLILTIDKDSITSKSFNIFINNYHFNSSDVVKIYAKKTPTTIISASLTPNLSNNMDNSRTVLIKDGSTTLIPTETYIIEILNNNDDLIASATFSVPAISDYYIKTYGDRIISISSKFPLKNWLSEKTILTPSPDNNIDISKTKYSVLSNFYTFYYSKDINTAIFDGLDWQGFFPINDLTGTSPDPFTARVSNDNMTLEIQSNLRSLPNTESIPHNIIINYSKAQKSIDSNKQIDINTVLVDLNNNDLPIKEKSFTLSKALEPAKATNVDVISRNNIKISYDKSVCLISTELSNIITIGDKNYSAHNAERFGNNFNIINYFLDNKLPIGDDIKILANQITDASGFKTQIVSPFIRKVIGISPKLESIVQKSSDKNETTLTVTFTMDMNISAATNINNYLLIDNGFNSSLVEEIKSIVKASSKTFTMTTTPLPIGSYRLNIINNIPSSEGDPIILPEYIDFQIIDLSIPATLAIYAPLSSRANLNDNNSKIVIMYNDTMSTNSLTGADNFANYMFNIYPTPIITPITPCTDVAEKQLVLENVTIHDIKDSQWFMLPLSTLNKDLATLNDNIRINIGYCGLNNIRNITNNSGNIYPLCCESKITGWLGNLDISNPNTKINIISSNEVELIYPSGVSEDINIKYSYFTKVDKKDFNILINNEPFIPASATLKDDMKSIIFKLPNTISFDSNDSVIIQTVDTIQNTKDLFDNLIVSSVSTSMAKNTIPPKLIAVSLESIVKGDESTINLLFNKELSNPSKNDFILFNNTEQLVINSAHIKNSRTNTIQIKVHATEFDTSDNVHYKVSSISNISLIETGTIEGIKIILFQNELVQQYRITSIGWKPILTRGRTYNLSNNSFIVNFSSSINFSTINNILLNYDSYTIQNVTVTQTTTPNITGIDINFANDNLGKITISTSNTATIQGTSTSASIRKNGANSVVIALANNDVIINQIPRDARLIVSNSSNIMNEANTLYLNKSYIPISIN